MRKIGIIGAGLCGLTIAQRLLSNMSNIEIVIFEKQPYGGGNLRESNLNGTIVHMHGPHIFHTKSENVWKFIKQFTTWEPYFHEVTAFIKGQAVPVPFNFKSIDMIFGDNGQFMKTSIIDEFGFGSRVPILKLLESNNSHLNLLGDEIFRSVYKGYTEKQWGKPISEVANSVLSRVPVVASYDSRYFDDKYQYLPKYGYNKLIDNMSKSINIEYNNNMDVDNKKLNNFDHVFCTSAIDEFFKYSLGKLVYRSLSFGQIDGSADTPYYKTCQTNFPNEYDFTRVAKYGFLKGQTNKPIFIAEYPKDCGENDHKYYPVSNDETKALFSLYKEKSKQIKNVTFAGRLADFKYYNMDQVIARGLKVSDTFMNEN